jgi:hypothetical protein
MMRNKRPRKKPRQKHFANTLCDLLSADEPADPRKAARWHWLHDTAEAWHDAHDRLNAAWDRTFAALPDDIGDEELEALNLPDPPEEAEVNALWAQLNDVIQKDLWPRHLYWGEI